MAKILIVEDDRSTLDLLKKALSGAGHECACLFSGSDVIERLKQDTPVLLLLDIMLPGTSGFEICRRVRRDPELYSLPILVISAMSSEEEVAHGLAQGADDYVTKPFDLSGLVRRIEALLDRHSTAKGMDGLTQLPGPDIVKREIQRRISCRDTFAVACVELVGIREFARVYGLETRNKAIRHLSRALTSCGQRLKSEVFFVGHFGGGYFVLVLGTGDVDLFCSTVQGLWSDHIRRADVILKQESGNAKSEGSSDAHRSYPEVLVCVTTSDAKLSPTPQQMFETLAQLRQKALKLGGAGIHVDQRGQVRG